MKPRKAARDYRDFGADGTSAVREFYRKNHAHQTLDFVSAKRAEYLPPRKRRMGVWEAIEFADTLVDESDPDIGLSQLAHAIQTAEALRAADAPRWLVLTGFVHDLGKLLCSFGEPQWAVVGDTFPVGCAFSDRIVYPEYFAQNPDVCDPRYASRSGVYEDGCGLDNILLSWGHDEYLYHVLRPHLPDPALAIIRYHSFYAWHRAGAYAFLMSDSDSERLGWVQRFNRYDLYSKSDEPPDWAALRPYYEDLVAEFLPPVLDW